MKPRGDAKPICSIRFLGRLESKVSTQALSSQHHTPPPFVPTYLCIIHHNPQILRLTAKLRYRPDPFVRRSLVRVRYSDEVDVLVRFCRFPEEQIGFLCKAGEDFPSHHQLATVSMVDAMMDRSVVRRTDSRNVSGRR